tara:strand:- start:3833 stop:4759 length:927 start_codon:yes stop_codon:yes gene_type:complete
MANGYSQSPSQPGLPQGRNPQTTNEIEVSYVDGLEEVKLTTDIEEYLEDYKGPYVEPIEPIPSPIIGEIKFQKTIYSQPSFRKRIDVSFNELNNKGEEVDIPDFFNQYRKLFYDIPKEGEFSHSILINTSTDYLGDFINPKDQIIDDLNDQIIELSKQLANAQAGFNPETGEEIIDDLIEITNNNARRLELVGDSNNPYIYWDESDEYNGLGLGVGLNNHKKYLNRDSYPGGLPNGQELESTASNQMLKDLKQAYENLRSRANRRTYNQWIEDIEAKSSGNRTKALKQLLDYHKNYQMDNLQTANSTQ